MNGYLIGEDISNRCLFSAFCLSGVFPQRIDEVFLSLSGEISDVLLEVEGLLRESLLRDGDPFDEESASEFDVIHVHLLEEDCFFVRVDFVVVESCQDFSETRFFAFVDAFVEAFEARTLCHFLFDVFAGSLFDQHAFPAIERDLFVEFEVSVYLLERV